MKKIFALIAAGTMVSLSVHAQNLVDVEQIRKSVSSNPQLQHVVSDGSSTDAKLRELALKEKNLESRLNQELAAPVKAAEGESKSSAPNVGVASVSAAAVVAPPQPVVVNDKELESAKARIARLTRDLDETKSRLIIAETEVERLTAMIDDKNRESLRCLNIPTKNAAAKARLNPADLAPLHSEAEDEAPVIGDKMTSAIPVATVIVARVALKVGPNARSSTLMQVERGSRLPVEGSEGDWYRVVAPSGARAWIPAAGVTLGDSHKAALPSVQDGDDAEGAFSALKSFRR